MPNIEVLAYVPNSMKEFLEFCVNGAPTPAGSPRPTPGVFKWLYSRELPEVHFFTSDPKDPLQVFGSTIVQPASEPQPVPWMDEIPGFKERVDGQLGKGAIPPPWHTTVTRNDALDKLFEQGRQQSEAIFASLRSDHKSGLTFTAQQFKAALRGDPKTDLASLLAGVEDRLEISALENVELAKITEFRDTDSQE